MEFERTIYNQLAQELESKKLTIIFGARQIGKTFLLEKLHKRFKDSRIFSLEEPDDLSLFNNSNSEILKLLRNSGSVILIDEFHYIKNASHIFKAIYDSGGKPKIYATGSSAIEMHKHLKESMAGRFKAYYLKPLSLEEFLTNKIGLTLDEFLMYGGLPGTYDPKENPERKDKQQYLKQILSTYIQKDIKSLIKEENISAFNNLLFILAECQGQIVSMSNLSRELGLSVNTINKYLSILEQTFVLYSLRGFSNNLSNELKKSTKFYFYDLGIRNALIKNFNPIKMRKDKGTIWETFVYQYLLGIQDESDTDIFFWRTSNNVEIDFVWVKNQVPIPIEVKSKLSSTGIPSSMKSFIRAYTNAPFAVILNENIEAELEYNGKTIHFIKLSEINILKEYLIH